MEEENIKQSGSGKKILLIGVILLIVVVVVLVVLIASFYRPAKKNAVGGESPVEIASESEGTSNQQQGGNNPVNTSLSVRSTDWCVANTIITIEKLPEKEGENVFKILTTRGYNNETVCYVKSLVNSNEYYFNKDYSKIYKLTRNLTAKRIDILPV